MGEIFLVKKDQFYRKKPYNIYLWKFDTSKYLFLNQFQKNDSTIYIANFQGKVIYANRQNITSLNMAKRPLVKRFIKSSLSKGQVYFSDDAASYSGFYAIIENSNIAIFAEASNEIILEKINALGKNFLLIPIAILLFTILLLILFSASNNHTDQGIDW